MGERTPGTLGFDPSAKCYIDGTMSRTTTPLPGPVGSDVSVQGMDLEDRFYQVLMLTGPKLPGEIREEFMAMLTPLNLGIMVGVLAAWAGSHYFGVGFIADAILLIGGVALIGWQVISAAQDLYYAIDLTYNARTCADLNQAASHLANFIAVVGVAVLMALIMKGAKGASAKTGSLKALVVTSVAAGAKRAGMTVRHFEIFRRVAMEMKQTIAVRFTNPKSVQWIERGYPAKPMEIKIKTSKETGIVTAIDAAETRAARDAGYLVVEADGVARGPFGRTLDTRTGVDWPVETGQVIHPTVNKPLVGDYDLLAVIDPNAPGRNIALATSNGQEVASRTNPLIEAVRRQLNSLMGEQRVMHGSHDAYGDLPSAVSKPGDGSVIFQSDGEVLLIETLEDLQAFYELIGRQTIKGSY